MTERNFHGERRRYGEPEFCDLYDPMRAVRTRDFHYIRYFDPDSRKKPWLPFEVPHMTDDHTLGFETLWPETTLPRDEEELFDIVHDPAEFRNIASHPEYAEVKKDLAAGVEKWMRDTDDHVLKGIIPKAPNPPGWGPWEGMK